MGDLLARRRIFQLDHRAVDPGLLMTSDLIRVLHEAPAREPLLGLHLRRALGTWRTHVRTHHALSRHVPRHGRRARLHRRVRNPGSSDFPRHQFADKVLGTTSGLTILAGIGICMLGIVFAGAAGMSKEKEMSQEQKRASIKEFNLKKGLLVATFSGVMSACFAYRIGCRRSHQSHHSPPRHARPVARASRIGRRSLRRIHHKLYLVRNSECPQPHGISIFQSRCRRPGSHARGRKLSSKM